MDAHTTIAGRVRIGLALDPHAYELLQEMATGPRGLGALLDLICPAAERRSAGEPQPRSETEPRRLYEQARLCSIDS